MIKNKRGVEINIATIIILVLAILVLVILAFFFSGGMKSLWEQIIGKKAVYTTTAIEDAKRICREIYSFEEFCTRKVTIRNKQNNKDEQYCCFSIPTLKENDLKYPYRSESDESMNQIILKGKTECTNDYPEIVCTETS